MKLKMIRPLRKRNHSKKEQPEILNADQKKVLYRRDYTVRQAGYAIGKDASYVKELIEKGLLGQNPKTKTIPRAEVDRYLMDNIEYKRQPNWQDKYK